MSASDGSLEDYFHQAMGLDPADREAWLRRELGAEPEKLQDVLQLVADYHDSSWLDSAPRVVQEAKKLVEDLRGREFGPFVIEEKIGSGGMGDVYLARQSEPVRRYVALKLILRDAAHQLIVQRFQREIQMLANMEHPNIARIIDAGSTESGFSYIAMEYVDGVDVLEYCLSKDLGIKARIELMLQCCRAIEHAHQKGIIHRDIKPNNVLITEVDGGPMVKVIDFGIAKATLGESVRDESSGGRSVVNVLSGALTASGHSPGTPPFMSPEQFSSNNDSVDSRSDIYSLGALLYVLITGRTPFDQSQLIEKSFDEIGQLVRAQDPPLPSRRVANQAKVLRGDLDSIVSKAMHRNIDKRYQSVTQLSEDLRHYLAGETVSTNRGSTWSQMRRFASRNRLVFGAATIAISGLILASIGLLTGWRIAIREKGVAVVDAQNANLLTASLRVQRQEYREALGGLELISGEIPGASKRLDYRLLRSQIPDSPSLFYSTKSKIYFGLVLPDRRAIACGCQDSTFRILDWRTGSESWVCETSQGDINGLAVSPDSRVLASAGDDGTVKIWDLNSKTLQSTIEVSSKSVFQVAWSGDGRFLITASSQPNAKVWTFPEGRWVCDIDSSGVDLECLSASQRGHFAFGDYRGGVRVGRFDSLETIEQELVKTETIFTKDEGCSTVALSESGRFLAIGLKRGYLTLMRHSDLGYQTIEQIRFPTDVTALAFSSDEQRLAIGDNSGGVHVLKVDEDIARKSNLHFTLGFFEVHSAQMGVGLGEQERQSRLQQMIESIDPPEAIDSLPYATDRVVIDFKEPLKRALFEDQFARRWQENTGDSSKDRYETPMRIYSDGKTIELIFESQLNRWSDPERLKVQRRLRSWSAHTKRVSGLAWGDSEASIFSFSEDQSIRKLILGANYDEVLDANAFDIYPVANSHLLLLDKDRCRISSYRYGGQGEQRIVSSAQSDIFHLVNAKSGCFSARHNAQSSISERHWGFDKFDLDSGAFVELAELPVQYHLEHLIGCPCENQWLGRFSMIGDQASSNSKLSFLGLWDGRAGEFIWKQNATTEPFRKVDLSSDNSYIVYEKNAVIWVVDVRTGKEAMLLEESGLSVSGLKFSPDSKWLAVVLNKDRSIRFYKFQGLKLLTPESKPAEIREHGGRTVDVAWSRDQSILLSVCGDGRLRSYDLASNRLSSEIAMPISEPKHLRISDDEQVVFVLGQNGSVLRIPCPSPAQ